MARDGVSAKRTGIMAILGPVCLALGFILGALAHSTQAPFLIQSADLLDPVGRLWLNALKVVVVPLVAILMVTGIAALPSGQDLGKWGGYAMASFFGLLAVGVSVALLAGSAFVSSVNIERVNPPAGVSPVQSPGRDDIADWFSNLIPGNFVESMAQGDLLPIAIVSTLAGLALRGVSQENREPVMRFAVGIREAILIYVGWVVMALPVGGFAMAYAFAAQTGSAVIGVAVQFILYAYVLMFGFLAFLYSAVYLIARIKPRVFARAALPAQIVALGTRSSLASLPSMVDSARSMKLPEPAADVVLPMAVSLFKLNRSLTSTSKLLFFAAVFGVALGPETVAAYVATIILISFSTPGLPTGAGASNLGAYMAAGLPAEGYMLIEAVNPILDPMNTVLNVTGDLAAAAITSRLAGTQSETWSTS